MAYLASGTKEEREELPPAPAWGSGDSSYEDDDELISLDKPTALPTLETVDDLLKELPCDASAPDLILLEPEPNRMPVARLALLLGTGAVFGALALGGALLLLMDPPAPPTEQPAPVQPAAAGVAAPKPVAVPTPTLDTNDIDRPSLPAEAPTKPTGRRKDADAPARRARVGTGRKKKRRSAQSRRKTSPDNTQRDGDSEPETDEKPAPLVEVLPGLDDLEAVEPSASTAQPDVPDPPVATAAPEADDTPASEQPASTPPAP